MRRRIFDFPSTENPPLVALLQKSLALKWFFADMGDMNILTGIRRDI